MQNPMEGQDPAQRVPVELLRHLHLVAQYAYPVVQTTSLEFIFEKLNEAPKIVRDLVPMSWTYLDAPPDGTVLLVYQSPHTRNMFASDGYLWADPEQYFRQDHNGFVIEMLVHNHGYNPLKESPQGYASHSRRRYRLVQNLNNPAIPCNLNLWIVHYSRSPQAFPASRVPVRAQESSIMAERRYLQSAGRLMDNKFMLEDHSNWPTVTPPGQPPQQRGMGPVIGFAGAAVHPGARHPMAQPGYAAEHTPNKRQRTGASNARAPPMHAQRPGQAAIDPTEVEEEEFKDLHDYLSQREISQMRYMQHHEWMEELYSSYPTFAIKPVSLGLGRKGELEPLTNGFFDPPRPPTPPGQSPKNDDAHYDTTIHKPLEPGQAEDFFVRANKKVEELNKEMAEMKLEHAKRMESFTRIKKLREAEKRLRSTVAAPGEGVDEETAKIDGGKSQIHDPARGDATIAVLRQMDQIDGVAKEVEGLTGKKIAKVENVKLAQKGGLVEETVPAESKAQGAARAGSAGDMASIFDDFLEPGAGERSMMGSTQPSAKPSASPQPVSSADQPMGGQGAGADDWVMVNKQDSQQAPALTASTAGDAPASAAAAASITGAVATNTSGGGADDGSPDANDEDLGDDLVDFGGDGANDAGFSGGAFDDAIDFGDLNTPGDDMQDFDEGQDEGVDVSLDMNTTVDPPNVAVQQNQGTGEGAASAGSNQAQVQVPETLGQGDDDHRGDNVEDDPGEVDLMEDSAFGDAFHHTENETQ